MYMCKYTFFLRLNKDCKRNMCFKPYGITFTPVALTVFTLSAAWSGRGVLHSMLQDFI